VAKRVSFSGQHLGLADIDDYHRDSEASLRLYFSSEAPTFGMRFLDCPTGVVAKQLHARLTENQLRECFTLLASLEAAFRIDFLQRCYLRDRSDVARVLIDDIKAAFRFRHWLAHGRYYTPKLGRQFDYRYLYELAEQVFESFPFRSS
jgi:hypothetical protein